MDQVKLKEYYIDLIKDLENQGYGRKQICKTLKWGSKKLTQFIYAHDIELTRYHNKPLTNVEEQVIIGSLLGDGSMSKINGHNVNSRLVIKHGEKQKEYIDYKLYLLKDLCKIKKVFSKYREDKRENWKSSMSHVLSTRQMISLTPYRKNWYPNGYKIIYRPDVEKLDALGLAIWFMDDGCKERYGFSIATLCFKREDVLFLQEFLKRKFSIDSTIRKDNSMHICSSSSKIFINLIKPYFVKSMLYKIEVTKLGELLEKPEVVNQQPSSENDIKVSEKVQRLIGEESTNNPNTSAQQLLINSLQRLYSSYKDAFDYNMPLYTELRDICKENNILIEDIVSSI